MILSCSNPYDSYVFTLSCICTYLHSQFKPGLHGSCRSIQTDSGMASFPLPLQKFEVRSTERPDSHGDGQGTGRSRSTSVGSSQKSLPGVWVNPPDALPALPYTACSSDTKESAPKGFEDDGCEGYMAHGPKMSDVSDVFGLRSDGLNHGLDQPIGIQGPQLPMPFPKATFDDFLSPTGSQNSEASPVAPPGLTLDPLDGLDACNDMAMHQDLWQSLDDEMEEMEMAPITPGVGYIPPTNDMSWPPLAHSGPSVGSGSHGSGQCKPCAFHHTKGCQRGAMCNFCHLCLPGEKKRRQKEKQQAAKARSRSVETDLRCRWVSQCISRYHIPILLELCNQQNNATCAIKINGIAAA